MPIRRLKTSLRDAALPVRGLSLAWTLGESAFEKRRYFAKEARAGGNHSTMPDKESHYRPAGFRVICHRSDSVRCQPPYPGCP